MKIETNAETNVKRLTFGTRPRGLEWQEAFVAISAIERKYAIDFHWAQNFLHLRRAGFRLRTKLIDRDECRYIFYRTTVPLPPGAPASPFVLYIAAGRQCDQYHCGHDSCNEARDKMPPFGFEVGK